MHNTLSNYFRVWSFCCCCTSLNINHIFIFYRFVNERSVTGCQVLVKGTSKDQNSISTVRLMNKHWKWSNVYSLGSSVIDKRFVSPILQSVGNQAQKCHFKRFITNRLELLKKTKYTHLTIQVFQACWW